MDKVAGIENTRIKIDRAIFQQIEQYLMLRASIDALITEGSTETAEDVEAVFKSANTNHQIIGNAITTLAHLLVSDDGDIGEIDATEDENGFILQ